MISRRIDALGRGDRADILGRRSGEVDHPLRIARPDRQLLHVDVGRVEQPALLGDREHGERVRPGLGGDRRPLERVEGDVDLRPAALRRADLLADIEHRRLVALALADHHRAVHLERVERRPHRLDGGMVGGLLVAPADQLRRRDRRRFGHPHHLQHQHPVENVACAHHIIAHPPLKQAAAIRRGPRPKSSAAAVIPANAGTLERGHISAVFSSTAWPGRRRRADGEAVFRRQLGRGRGSGAMARSTGDCAAALPASAPAPPASAEEALARQQAALRSEPRPRLRPRRRPRSSSAAARAPIPTASPSRPPEPGARRSGEPADPSAALALSAETCTTVGRNQQCSGGLPILGIALLIVQTVVKAREGEGMTMLPPFGPCFSRRPPRARRPGAPLTAERAIETSRTESARWSAPFPAAHRATATSSSAAAAAPIRNRLPLPDERLPGRENLLPGELPRAQSSYDTCVSAARAAPGRRLQGDRHQRQDRPPHPRQGRLTALKSSPDFAGRGTMRSMVEGSVLELRRTPPPRFARSPSPANAGEEFTAGRQRFVSDLGLWPKLRGEKRHGHRTAAAGEPPRHGEDARALDRPDRWSRSSSPTSSSSSCSSRPPSRRSTTPSPRRRSATITASPSAIISARRA